MQLQEFFDYKNQLSNDLLTNETIVHLINDEIDFSEAGSLMYTQIFPYEYIPETIQKGLTYICIDVDIQRALNKTYLLPILYVWIFSHRSRLRLPEGGVRVDKLCNEICQVINGSTNYGLGRLMLNSVKRFAPVTDYQGKCLVFTATDFNRVFDGTKPIPSNRRTG